LPFVFFLVAISENSKEFLANCVVAAADQTKLVLLLATYMLTVLTAAWA
jgi:hypothetical protein